MSTAAALLLAACGGDARDPGVSSYGAPPQSVEEAYGRMSEAMRVRILHSRAVVAIVDEGQERPDHSREYWIDAKAGAARMEFVLDPSVDSYDRAVSGVTIVNDTYYFVPDDEDEALRHEMTDRCAGTSDVLVAFLLNCNDDYGQYTFSPPGLDAGATFDGGSAIAIIAEGAGESNDIVNTTVLDRETYLPLAKVDTITSNDGSVIQYTAEYEHEFIDVDDLRDDFLDPRSIGYGPPSTSGDTLDGAGQDVPVYWVGEEYATASGDEFVLARLPQPLYGDTAALVYETPGGSWAFEILVFSRESWNAFLQGEMGTRLTNRDCVSEGTLPGTDARLFTIPWPDFPVSDTPQTPEEVCDLVVAKEPELVRWGHLAVVEFDGAVVAVGGVARGVADPPEREADLALLANVVRDLQLR
jgi:hypothetical protein